MSITVTLDRSRLDAAVADMIRQLPLLGASDAQRRADAIIEETQERWPVDTGRSRDGWETSESVEDGVTIIRAVNVVEYAIWIEVGTRFQPPGNYLSTAIANATNSPDVADITAEILDAWKGATS